MSAASTSSAPRRQGLLTLRGRTVGIVGIVLTVIGGRYAIQALQRYLERQKLAEAQPAQKRQREMDYDQAQARMSKNICPGCERAVDMKDGKTDFCPHCGLCLFDHCGHCNTRKNAFARYCFSCGTSAKALASPATDTHAA